MKESTIVILILSVMIFVIVAIFSSVVREGHPDYVLELYDQDKVIINHTDTIPFKTLEEYIIVDNI